MTSPILPAIPTRAAERYFWGKLEGAAQALAMAEAAKQQQGLTLIITKDSAGALRLKEELRFFAEKLPVLYFPDWEILPYVLFSPTKVLSPSASPP